MNVQVVEYSSDWKAWFQTLESRLTDAIKGIDYSRLLLRTGNMLAAPQLKVSMPNPSLTLILF
ncbi:hypothetical protein [uncultured Shewanella sp.]|uniref:hypothetical protein n=1 Tax=uncultured Shewanella sp. TaxID=173975 RepID=UPI00261F53F0|nr:hypothetical protein [uncultured Shewanella sp.]